MNGTSNRFEDIPQDWFVELGADNKPNMQELQSIDFNLYQSNCPELLGNMILELYLCKDGFYYMLMRIREPIGDYGSYWAEYWYKCEEQYIGKINEILLEVTK